MLLLALRGWGIIEGVVSNVHFILSGAQSCSPLLELAIERNDLNAEACLIRRSGHGEVGTHVR